MKLYLLFLALILLHQSIAFPSIQSEDTNNSEKDNESSKKIIGSSVVTSVSVILNGEEPQYTDAVGKLVPKSQMPLQVASPINLLNPDRYEFFTFDDSGQLVKRLMTLKEIQSIVANGDGEGATVIHNSAIDEKNPEKNVQDIVASVQNVLTKEVEGKKNFSLSEQHILDTPDVSSSWSMILPAIFGNTGGDIFPQSKPQQVVMMPDSDVFEHQPTKPSKRPSKPKPTKKRPSTSTSTETMKFETTTSQKIFMNNEELVKPLFNRIKNGAIAETTYMPVYTTIHTSTDKTLSTTKRKKKPTKTSSSTDNQTTTKRTTIKRKQTTKPTKQGLSSTEPNSSTSKTVVIKKKYSTTASPEITEKVQQTIQKRKPTTSQPAVTQKQTTSNSTKTSLNSRKPIQQTTQQFGTTQSLESTQRIPTQKYKKKTTTTKKPSSVQATKSSQTTIKSKTTSVTTKKPSRISTTKVKLTTRKPEVQDDSYYTDSTTALSVDSIIDSLTQSQEDINTKLSFNQIMESLQDKNSIKTTETNLLNQSKIQPVLYNNADALQEMQTDTNSRITLLNLKATTESATGSIKPLTFDTTTYNPIFEESTITPNEYTFIKDGSNVVKIEPLFAELLDPILSDLTTTELPITTDNLFITNKDEESVTQSIEKLSSTEYLDGSTEDINYEKLPDIKISEIKYKHELPKDNILEENENKLNLNDKNEIKKPNEITEKVQNVIDANESQKIPINSTPIQEISKQKLNTINQQTEMTMSDFRKTAATLASMLENSEELLTTTENSIQNNFEIQSLLSDVISQITDVPPPSPLSDKINDETNRFTNLAQINANMFLSSPSSSFNLNTNDKFHTIESLSLKLNKTKDFENNLFLRDHVENEITTTFPLLKDELVKDDNEMNKIDLHKENEFKTTTDSPQFDGKNNKNNIFSNEQTSTNKLGYNSETTLTPINNEFEMTTLFSTSSESNELISLEETSDEKASKKEDDMSYYSTTELDKSDLNFKESKETDVSIENKSIEDSTEISENPQISTEQFSDESQDSFVNSNSRESTTESSQELDSTTGANENSLETTTDLLTLVELITLPSKHDVKSTESSNTFNMTETEDIYTKLGEITNKTEATDESVEQTTIIKIEQVPIITSTTSRPDKRKPITLKPVHYFKQPASQTDQKLIAFNGAQQRPLIRPPSLTNLKINQISQASRAPVKLEPTPEKSLGLEESTQDLQEDIQEFSRLCNELAFSYWRSITSEKISPARSLVISPFAITSMLSMVFLGARGSTSGEMNEILRLDDMVTFNPHLVFKNITESVENAKDSDIASSAFVREVFSDRTNGKILQFFKEKTQQLYSGHVEEVNFNVVNDIIRRRTNFLVKKHTMGKIMEYLRTNSVWVNGPLSTISANLFQTDCVRGSTQERDGEMFFQVHPSVRQRRLVPVPAVVWRSGFTAGYDHEIDATVVAFGNIGETVSVVYVMPGQHGIAVPGDNLERLEKNIMENGISKNVWSHLLTTLMERPGLEVQLPRFSHRSFVNASLGLQKLGLKTLFNSENADLRGLTGSSNKDVYLADMIQINTFSTCGEGKIGENHHVEMYPAPPLRKRNSDIGETTGDEHFLDEAQVDFGSIVHESARGFYDDLLDPKYLELPLPLRPRQARIPDAPRLRFDKPFLYFVRHNPTGMILFMGRFNPRLLP